MEKFQFKPFDEMTPEDYAKVGFKSGLEVHQQLLTDRKLFCRCPAGKLHNEGYHSEILRHMRPTLSELGEYDGTALMEFKTQKNITYRIDYDTVCTYEMDDTPPFMIDDVALDISIEIGLLYGASIVDELHIARKQYLDGSIPTGFQRTAITCVGGSVPYNGRDIKLIQMSIEEDSSRERSDIGHDRVYITDRLGMPLIETVTHPEMKTPQEIADVNNIIRKLARTTGKVRTGIGAGRQDVNVSVEGGTRIEIKGVSQITKIPLLAYHESMRQWNLLLLRDELHARGITEETFESTIQDASGTLRKTKYSPIKSAIDRGWKVNCVNLKGFKGLLNWKTQTDTYFSKEISDRVRVIACLTTLPNILHSDNPMENLTATEWTKLKHKVNAEENDTIVLVWGDDRDVKTGAGEIEIRAKEATIGIPSETRQALADGTVGFERILPGPERMYPDTDLPPVIITAERRKAIIDQMPKPYWEQEAEYRKLGIKEVYINQLTVSDKAALFDEMREKYDIDLNLICRVLFEHPARLKKIGYNIEYLTDMIYDIVFEAYANGKIVSEGLFYLMLMVCMNEGYSELLMPTIAPQSEIDFTIVNCKNILQEVPLRHPEKYTKLLTGMVMDELRGRANGKDILKIIEADLEVK